MFKTTANIRLQYKRTYQQTQKQANAGKKNKKQKQNNEKRAIHYAVPIHGMLEVHPRVLKQPKY